jgi:outer membrane protein assembly factor BamB
VGQLPTTNRSALYYIVVRRARTTRCCVARALSAVLILAGWGFCPHSIAAAQSPQQRYEEIERGFRDARPSPLPLLAIERAWTLRINSAPSAAAAMDRERIYVPLRDNFLVALARETGILAWIRPYGTAAPLVLGGSSLFFVGDDAISALDAASGTYLWKAPIDAPLSAPVVWDSGWLFALTQPGDLLAFRAADGKLIWKRSFGTASAHPPVPGGVDTLYVSLADSRLVAVDISTGDVQWERQLTGTLSPPASGRDRVFVGSTNNFLYALDEETGREKWKWRNGGDVIGASVEGNVVYFASLDNIIRAVNRGNGNQRWRKPTGTRPVLPPRAFRGIVVLPGLMPAVSVFVALDGTVMGTHAVEGDLVGAPLIDPAAPPGQVALVTITREGVVDAMRPTGLLFRESATTPVAGLPGRPLTRERNE